MKKIFILVVWAVFMANNAFTYTVKILTSDIFAHEIIIKIEDLPADATISDLKRKVSLRIQKAPETMAIFINGEQMSDSKLIKDIAQLIDNTIDIWILEEQGLPCAII